MAARETIKVNVKRILLTIAFASFILDGYAQGLTPDASWLGSVETGKGEVLYLHTDRNFYAAGEDIQFMVYMNRDNTNTTPSKVLYLELTGNAGTAVSQKRTAVRDGIVRGIISIPDSITTGDYLLRAYTRQLTGSGLFSLCNVEIKVFNPFKNPMTPPESNGPVSADGSTDSDLINPPASSYEGLRVEMGSRFKTREKVSLKITTDPADTKQQQIKALSISVAVKGATQNPTNESGSMRPAVNFFSQSVKKADSSIQPETLGPQLSGTLLNRTTLTPEPGIPVTLTYPGKIPCYQYSYTGSTGVFNFTLPNREGWHDIVIHPSDLSTEWIVKLNSPYFEGVTTRSIKNEEWTPELIRMGERLSINHQISEIYSDYKPAVKESEVDLKKPDRFYDKAAHEIVMADYIVLPSLEEVFDELVPGITYRRSRSGHTFTVTNELSGLKSEEPPLVMVDGVIVTNHSALISLAPDIIERIDVIRREYQLGHMHFSSIISIVTREGDKGDLNTVQPGVRTSYNALEPMVEKENLKYSDTRTAATRIPDFRNTLYWKTIVKPDRADNIELEFFTSDYQADFTVDIKGVYTNGTPFSYSGIIRVSNK